MKKNLIGILYLISMVIIISHDIIPHLHPDKDDIELISGRLTDHHSDNKDADHNHRSHFPPHQHVSSDSDFLAQRNTISLNKVIKDSLHEYRAFNAQIIDFSNDACFAVIRELKEPLNPLSIILPCNFTRGSPFYS